MAERSSFLDASLVSTTNSSAERDALCSLNQSNNMKDGNSIPHKVSPLILDTMEFKSKHALQHKWTLWHDEGKGNRAKNTNGWIASLTKVSEFDTVELFWATYYNMVPPSRLGGGSNYWLFKSGVQPMWEDPMNEQGGKWSMGIAASRREDKLDECWLATMLGLIGETMEDEGEVMGAVVSIRKMTDRLAVWTQWSSKEYDITIGRIGARFKSVCNFRRPNSVSFKSHDEVYARARAAAAAQSSINSSRSDSVQTGGVGIRDRDACDANKTGKNIIACGGGGVGNSMPMPLSNDELSSATWAGASNTVGGGGGVVYGRDQGTSEGIRGRNNASIDESEHASSSSHVNGTEIKAKLNIKSGDVELTKSAGRGRGRGRGGGLNTGLCESVNESSSASAVTVGGNENFKSITNTLGRSRTAGSTTMGRLEAGGMARSAIAGQRDTDGSTISATTFKEKGRAWQTLKDPKPISLAAVQGNTQQLTTSKTPGHLVPLANPARPKGALHTSTSRPESEAVNRWAVRRSVSTTTAQTKSIPSSTKAMNNDRTTISSSPAR
eukprot:CFRG2021T1